MPLPVVGELRVRELVEDQIEEAGGEGGEVPVFQGGLVLGP